jgi:superfamily II DNA or RNA helicase
MTTVIPSVGSTVEARGERWVLVRKDAYDRCAVCRLEGFGSSAGRRLTLVEPFDRLRVVHPSRLRRRARQHVLRVARGAIARARPADGLWTATRAQITLLPYQLEPALAVLGGLTRVLLADAVGLGKTVQAGLILAELRARGLADRALVLTPAGLRHPWAAELRDRFGLSAAIVDQSTITNESWLAAADVNPWTCHHLIVSSIDFVKRPDVLASVEAAPFDLLIVDEAHHLTPGSDRGGAVERLAARTPWLILASATPHSGDESAFTYLQSLGAHDEPLAIFRRSRAEVGMANSRRTCLLAVTPTRDEAEMLDAVDRYTEQIWRARGATDASVQLIAMTLRRRAASSATAVLRTLMRRQALLKGQQQPQLLQPSLPWEETEDEDADGSDGMLAAPGLDDAREEQSQIDRLIELARRALLNPSKAHRLLRLIDCAHEPVVIFTEYRDTADALASALSPARSLAIIHGGLPIELRRAAIDRFTKGSADVLVATDAAGEGLNLQHRCRLAVNVELPWNPLRLEQRIGRIDRIGQTRRVHAVHLFHRNTVEETVLARLERRRLRAAIALNDSSGAARSQSAVSEVSPASLRQGSGGPPTHLRRRERQVAAEAEWSTEREIASTIFGEAVCEARQPSRLSSARVSRAAEEVRRLEQQRAWQSSIDAAVQPVWAAPRETASANWVVCLYETRHLASCGLTIEHQLNAVVLELARSPANRRERRQFVRAIERVLVQAPQISARDLERSGDINLALRPFRDAILRRLHSIRTTLAHARRRQWQGSLFDRRAERDEERRLDALDVLESHVARKAALIDGLTPVPEQVRRTLLAVWPPS